MKQYKDELLASCLHLLLSLPRQLVQVNIAALVPALQVYYDVAMTTRIIYLLVDCIQTGAKLSAPGNDRH